MKKLFVKKFIASLAVACMVITAFPQFEIITPDTVYAADAKSADTDTDADGDGVTEKGYVYVSNGTGTVKITRYNGTETAVTIPKAISVTVGSTTTEYSVTELGANSLAGNAGLTSVVMQGNAATSGSKNTTSTHPGLLKIGDQAFYGCPSLTTVTVPNTVTSMGQQVFGDCPRLSSITVTAGNQHYISYDGVLYEYNGGSTYGTYTLVQYPVGKVGSIFAAPSDIATRITAIGTGAFSGSLQLETIELPGSVSTIGANAFSNCTGLKTINIPEKVTMLGNSTFEGCTSLESITLPNTVVAIGSNIFSGCTSLSSVKLPSNLTTIPTKAFYGCSALTEITVPSKVTSIDYDAFAYCTSLRKATIPTSVVLIQSGAFTGDLGVTIYAHSGSYGETYATNNHLGKVATLTVKFYSDAGALLDTQEIVYGSAATAPYVTPRPGYELSWSTSFSSITSDLSVTAIWTRVYSVTFNDSYNERTEVVKVAYGKKATAPSWKLSGYTLSWDKSLKNITSDTTINAIWTDPSTGYQINNADAKPAKKGTMIEAASGTYKVVSSDIQNPKVKFMGNSDGTLTVVNIPSTITVDGVKYKVTQITAGAFKENTTIKSVVIGSNVKLIGSACFKGCTALTKVTIKSKKLKTVNMKAFYNLSKSCYIYAYNSKLKTYKKLIQNSGLAKTTKITMKKL
ncbi:MAG: leucine-rich repeat domain-containing protein [Lachnospiraceae bacterium]|nr:leucine-rich repeat domain-containing protein [Lachnospiraceae bacterium]